MDEALPERQGVGGLNHPGLCVEFNESRVECCMRWCLGIALAFLTTQALAVVPRQALIKLRERASDVVVVQIIDFQSSASTLCPAPCKQHDIKAKVVKVVRSRSGLVPSQIIDIQYTYKPLRNGEKGAKPTIAPPEGTQTCAYLSGSVETGFSPVARSKSFSKQCE